MLYKILGLWISLLSLLFFSLGFSWLIIYNGSSIMQDLYLFCILFQTSFIPLKKFFYLSSHLQ